MSSTIVRPRETLAPKRYFVFGRLQYQSDTICHC
jgi:hypothetical protein